MPVTLTITVEAEDLADLGNQLDNAVSAFRPMADPAAYTADHAARANAASPRKGRVSAASRAQAAGGDAGVDGGAEAGGLAGLADEQGLGGDRGGPGDDLAAGEPPVAQSPPAARRGRPPKGGAADSPQPDGDAALPQDEAGGEADQQVGPAERGAATLAEVQTLAKRLGGVEEKGVAAVQRIFADHGVKTPKDIDPAKLETLRAAFEAELGQ